MEARLYAFGCSNSFGVGLSDTGIYKTEHSNDIPSKFSWPQMLADATNMQCKNLSVPGASNKLLWHDIVSIPWHTMDCKNTVVVIHWSFIDRHVIFKTRSTMIHMLICGFMCRGARAYYKHLYFDYNNNMELELYANHVKLMLDKLGIENYHFDSFDRTHFDNKVIYKIPKSNKSIPKAWRNELIPKPGNFAWSEIDWQPTNLVSIQNKNNKNFNAYGVDGCHPGYHIHKNFAEFALLLLKKQNSV